MIQCHTRNKLLYLGWWRQQFLYMQKAAKALLQ